MKKKTFIGILLICLVIPISMFGAYQVGVNSTSFKSVSKSIEDYQKGFLDGQNSTLAQQQNNDSYSLGYRVGYQAGLKASLNITIPTS